MKRATRLPMFAGLLLGVVAWSLVWTLNDPMETLVAGIAGLVAVEVVIRIHEDRS
jgi:cobalamin synthase